MISVEMAAGASGEMELVLSKQWPLSGSVETSGHSLCKGPFEVGVVCLEAMLPLPTGGGGMGGACCFVLGLGHGRGAGASF